MVNLCYNKIPLLFIKVDLYSNIGDDFSDKITDYLGETDVVDENSYIHMTEQDYSLNLTDAFLEYISNSQYVDGAQECPKPEYLKILKI